MPIHAPANRRLSRPGRLAPALLVLLCVAVYLPGTLRLPVVDRDEARFAQASRQMFESVALPRADRDPTLHSGGLVVPMLADAPRLNKGPLIYWLQAASAAACAAGDPSRDAVWMYRLPSLLAAVATVLMTRQIGRVLFTPLVGDLAAALLAVAPVFAWEAAQARSDQVLVACTTMAVWRLAVSWTTGRTTPVNAAAIGVAVAAGVLTKGPITPLVVSGCAVALTLAARRFAWLGWRVTGLIILVVVAAVGAWAVPLSARVGLAGYLDTVLDETVVRAARAKENHAGPPGYHLVLLAALFWPGSLRTAAAIAAALSRANGPADPAAPRLSRLFAPRRAAPAELFCLAWIIPAWLVFEFASTKLPHYTMPLYPAVALLTARLVLSERAAPPVRPGVADRVGRTLWIGLGLALCVGLPSATLALELPHAAALVVAVLTAAAAVPMILAARHAWAGSALRACRLAIVAAAVIVPTLNAVALPAAGRLWISDRVMHALPAQCQDAPIAAVGYHEDSLVFHTRGRLSRLDDPTTWTASHPEGVLIVPHEQADEHDAQTIARIRGFNYATGRSVDLAVLDLAKERPR